MTNSNAESKKRPETVKAVTSPEGITKGGRMTPEQPAMVEIKYEPKNPPKPSDGEQKDS